MKGKYFLSVIFWLLVPFATIQGQQNLVYNGSFEKHWYCPPVISKDSFPCKGWRSPNSGTPDYYNRCSQVFEYSIPDNSAGSYDTHSGDAYFGLGLISVEQAWIEHIQGHLTEPLKAGQQYKVSFWVRLAYQYSDYTAYNIGLYFSKNKEILGDYLISKDKYIEGMTPELKAHISNEKEKFITDTIWVEISGTYLAQGGEKYITIGMFWDDHPKVVKAWKKARENQSWGNTKRFGRKVKKYLLKKNLYMEDKYKNFPDKGGQHYPYYLIDDVSVVKIEQQ